MCGWETDLRVGAIVVGHDQSMTYIVQRRNLFYVVGYDGIDAISGKERRAAGTPPASTVTMPSSWPAGLVSGPPGRHY